MRMLRKKLACALLAVLICLPALAGCHGSKGLAPFVMPETLDLSRTYEIVFWAKNDTNKMQTRIYEKAISDFTSLYPNISVKLRLYTDYGRIYNDVITNISTNTTPNVCIAYPDHIATYLLGANCVVPLDGLFDDVRYGLGGSELRFDAPTRGEMIDKYLNECAFGGHHYAIPYMRSTEACYINKTYVEALGYTLPDVLTWDFLWEVAEAAARKDASGMYALNGQNVMLPFIYKSTDNMMIQMLRQKGAGYATADGQIQIFNDTTRELLRDIATHVENGAFSTFKISSYPANFLNAGQCVFAVDSTAGSMWMGSNAHLLDISPDQLVEYELVVRPVPQFDPEHPLMISQGPSVCVFNKSDPQEVLCAWLFAQYLLTNDVQIAYAQTEGYVPVTQKARTAPEYLDYLAHCGEDGELYYEVKIQAAQMLLANTDRTFVTPVFNGSASLRDAAGQMIENVAKSVRRKQTVDDAYYDRLFSDVSSLYRLDQRGRSTDTVGGAADLGPLPPTATALLWLIGGAWTLIGLYAALGAVRRRRLSRKGNGA